jgi:FkbM family methyltransferase
MKRGHRLARFLPRWLVGFLRHVRTGGLFTVDARISFSQEGEDLTLQRIVGDKHDGFFVDVGAHHPTRFSNTHLLYQRGWTGINIDATPGSMAVFRKKRRRDINLEVAIAREPGVVVLHLFDDPALNSASEELSYRRERESEYRIVGTVEVPARPLREVLDEHLPRSVTEIDLLTIDVEGHDFDVLASNDWTRFRPRVLLLERLNSSVEEVVGSREAQFLQSFGYVLHSKLVNSIIFVSDPAPP